MLKEPKDGNQRTPGPRSGRGEQPRVAGCLAGGDAASAAQGPKVDTYQHGHTSIALSGEQAQSIPCRDAASISLNTEKRNMNKSRKLLVLAGASLAFGVTQMLAVGTADATITGGADNASATFDYVKPLMIAIGVFTIGYGYFKRMRRA